MMCGMLQVAPGQYEFSPTFGPVSEHVDQNLMLMQIIDEVGDLCRCI